MLPDARQKVIQDIRQFIRQQLSNCTVEDRVWTLMNGLLLQKRKKSSGKRAQQQNWQIKKVLQILSLTDHWLAGPKARFDKWYRRRQSLKLRWKFRYLSRYNLDCNMFLWLRFILILFLWRNLFFNTKYFKQWFIVLLGYVSIRRRSRWFQRRGSSKPTTNCARGWENKNWGKMHIERLDFWGYGKKNEKIHPCHNFYLTFRNLFITPPVYCKIVRVCV